MTATTTDGARATVPSRPEYRRRTFTESKKGFKTSEFYLTILAVAGVLFAAYVDSDSLSRSDGWRYAIFAVMAYVVSRGLAKLGTREPRTDDQ